MAESNLHALDINLIAAMSEEDSFYKLYIGLHNSDTDL